MDYEMTRKRADTVPFEIYASRNSSLVATDRIAPAAGPVDVLEEIDDADSSEDEILPIDDRQIILAEDGSGFDPSTELQETTGRSRDSNLKLLDQIDALEPSRGLNLHILTELLYIVMEWLRPLTRIIFFAVLMYIILAIIRGMHHDLQFKHDEYASQVTILIRDCERSFTINKCADPVPAVEKACYEWQMCMLRDPLKGKRYVQCRKADALCSWTANTRLKFGAETIAEILQSFIDPLSFRTLGVLVVTFIVVGIVGSCSSPNHARTSRNIK